MTDISRNHPRQKLLFAVEGPFDDEMRIRVRECLAKLARSRQWLLDPPEYVDHSEEPEDKERGDLPLETLGGVLEIYSAHPPHQLPKDVDRQCLEDVKSLVSRLMDFSREADVTFEVELDGNFVGAIEAGRMDKSLAEGFIGEWERHLA
jgi:hypothetical protein